MTGRARPSLRAPGALGHRSTFAAFAVLAVLAAGVAVMAGDPHAARNGALAAAVAAGLLLDVEVPAGGRFHLAHALVMALVLPLAPGELSVVVALGMLAALPLLRARHGSRAAVTRVAAVAAGGVAAAAVHALGDTTFARAGSPRAALGSVLVSGLAYLAVVFGPGHLSRRRPPRSLRRAAPVYATLLCAAALLGLSHDQGWWAFAGATLPLLVTRYSFERYSLARRAYRQTVQALGIVPELADHAPLGHAERTAAYVRALAPAAGVPPVAVEPLVTAARLHHIGHLALPEAPEQGPAASGEDVAVAGAALLRETGVFADIAELVEASAPGSAPRDAAAAVLQVACAFDLALGEDPAGGPAALALVAGRFSTPEAARVVDALRSLVAGEEQDVDGIIERGAPVRRAAAAARRRPRAYL